MRLRYYSLIMTVNFALELKIVTFSAQTNSSIIRYMGKLVMTVPQ